MYTREEREIIKNNIKKIENYCKTEIVPLISDYDVIADCSEIRYRKSDGSAFKKTYFLKVCKDGTVIFGKGGSRYIITENPEPCEWNIYESLSAMEDLLIRWQTAKTKLLCEIKKQKTSKLKVLNFEI